MAKVNYNYIIGIDEVGRGSLAGPIVVAALALPLKLNLKSRKLKIQIKNQKLILKDSKKLSSRQREIWFQYIKYLSNPSRIKSDLFRIFYSISSVSPSVIDKINIAQAANLAATRAFQKLLFKKNFNSINRTKVFLDGGLHLNTQTLLASGYWLRSNTITKGDEKIPAIMLASIVAKVNRDWKMKKLHLEYPSYDFINNVGYGTKKHRRAIKKQGPTKVHRLTFIRRYTKLKS